MMKVKFLREYLVKDGTGTCYKAGQVVELADDSAQHFLRRRVAVIAIATEETAVEVAAVEPPERTVLGRGRPRKLAPAGFDAT